MANNEGHEGAESLQAAVNYFFYLAKCYWPIVAIEICRRTTLKKKMVSTSERKEVCVCFQFCSHSHSFPEKKKRKRLGTRWRGKQNGECSVSNCGRSKVFQWYINASLHTYSWRCELKKSRTSMRITVVDPDFDGKSGKWRWKTLFWDNNFDLYRRIF